MLPPYSNEDTSKDAAKAIAKKTASIRERVYNYIVTQGGATADEIEVNLPIHSNTLTPRLWELEGKGKDHKGNPRIPKIYKSDVKRPTRSGCQAWVYQPL